MLGARQDLGMGKGKIASQCCHAAVACYEEAANSCPEMLEEWLDQGQRKIVVKVTTCSLYLCDGYFNSIDLIYWAVKMYTKMHAVFDAYYSSYIIKSNIRQKSKWNI